MIYEIIQGISAVVEIFLCYLFVEVLIKKDLVKQNLLYIFVCSLGGGILTRME